MLSKQLQAHVFAERMEYGTSQTAYKKTSVKLLQ